VATTGTASLFAPRARGNPRAGVFAEFEREMIRERVLAGQARARASGVRFGRPTIPADRAAAIVADLKTGVGVVKLAKLHGVGLGTVQKLKARLAA
jgi:DNA invertase Pin-like site-specific DNA recombinase